MISSVAVLDPASARALAVTRSPAAPASAQAPALSAFRRDTPIFVMSILLFQFLGLVASGAVLSVEKVAHLASLLVRAMPRPDEYRLVGMQEHRPIFTPSFQPRLRLPRGGRKDRSHSTMFLIPAPITFTSGAFLASEP